MTCLAPSGMVFPADDEYSYIPCTQHESNAINNRIIKHFEKFTTRIIYAREMFNEQLTRIQYNSKATTMTMTIQRFIIYE